MANRFSAREMKSSSEVLIERQQSVHVNGLDTVRAVLACWVVIHHSPFGKLPFPVSDHHSLRTAIWMFQVSFNGQAAVIAFFIVSGFCIHWPYATGKQMITSEFLVQRLLRIGIPLAVALILGWSFGVPSGSFWKEAVTFGVPIWSLWCEMMYYLIYPVIYWLIRRRGVNVPLVLSFIPAAFALCSNHQWSKPFFYLNGGTCFWMTALMGLPFWLAGSWLAESVRTNRSGNGVVRNTKTRLWLCRLAMYWIQGLMAVLAFKFGIGLPLMLFLSLPFFVFWIRNEISYYSQNPEPPLVAWLGGISYSIYLVHVSFYIVLQTANVQPWPLLARWLLSVGVILFGSWMFYRIAELPSHRLAKIVGKRLRLRDVVTGMPNRIQPESAF